MLQLAIDFPAIRPEIIGFDIFGRHFGLTWYAISYMVGIIICWRVVLRVIAKNDYPHKSITPQVIDDFLFYAIIGIILGGRLFYTLVYQPGYYLSHPLEIIMPPYAGLSFHGGFIGFIIAVIITARKHKTPVLALGDLMALVTPITIFLVRCANFINGELWGKETNVAWAMKFPTFCRDPEYQGCANIGEWHYYGNEMLRHPSQLYEAGLEGLLLGAVLWFLYRRDAVKFPGRLIGVFFIGYGLARIFIEFFRNADRQFISPDNPLGHVIRFGDWGLSMGQTLSLPMLLIGIGFLWYSSRRHDA